MIDRVQLPRLVDYPAMPTTPVVRLRDLSVKSETERNEIQAILERFMSHGQWIMGQEVADFESDVASFFSRKHCIAVSSASAGLYLTMKALGFGPGDEVITTPMSWLVTSSAIALTGAHPVFVDVDSNFNLNPQQIERAITKRTRAILPVHFYGRVARMPEIIAIARQHDLLVLEDVAQAVGAELNGARAGTFGDVAVVSFSPMKVVGGLGDAGAVVCDDDNIAEDLRLLRHCGTVRGEICVVPEIKHNIDALNAAVIRVRLAKVSDVIAGRRQRALRYSAQLEAVVECPNAGDTREHSFFDYTIRCARRDYLLRHLIGQGIEVKIRHPILICDQPIFRNLRRPSLPLADRFVGEILCLPLHDNLDESEIDFVAKTVLEFSQRS